MDDFIAGLVDTVTKAGGSIDWSDLLDSVDYKDRQQVPYALKIAKSEGKLYRQVSVSDGKTTHVVTTTAPPPKNQP